MVEVQVVQLPIIVILFIIFLFYRSLLRVGGPAIDGCMVRGGGKRRGRGSYWRGEEGERLDSEKELEERRDNGKKVDNTIGKHSQCDVEYFRKSINEN